MKAMLLERELSQMSGTIGTSFEVLNVSAKDILLGVVPSPSVEQRRFILSDASTATSRTIQRLLVIDDLDVVIVDSDEEETASTSNNLESEQLRALNAIVKLIDTSIASSNCFAIGISRTSLARLPTQLARVGRIEKEVLMAPPSLRQRKDIFEFWLSTLPTNKHLSASTMNAWADQLAPRTAGCVASDIQRICADALTAAIARQSQSLEQIQSLNDVMQNTCVEWNDIREASQMYIPSQLSAMDVIPPKFSNQYNSLSSGVDLRTEFDQAWKEFGGYNDMKTRLFRTVVRPWRYHIMKSESSALIEGASAPTSIMNDMLDSSRPSGILFHGPAGNGKTLAAMCLASSLGLNCVKVSRYAAACFSDFSDHFSQHNISNSRR
jgi:SpoVK/Ycf46/Vps4 family AAA+-type ATPase